MFLSLSRPGWFRAFWRWHFYASFLVIPVLLVLSVTGLIYLFRFQLEPLLHADVMKVAQPAGTDVAQPYAGQLAAVEKAHPGRHRRLDGRAALRRAAAPSSRSPSPTAPPARCTSTRGPRRCSATSTPTPP